MNKKDLVYAIAQKHEIPNCEAEAIINTTITFIKNVVNSGHDLKVRNFGIFTKIKRKARNGRNPITGKKIVVPSQWTPKFKAGAEFREMVKR